LGNFLIKLIDFGCSKIFNKDSKYHDIVGTAYYIAPEVLNNNYNEMCDNWSCGVIMYMLLTGSPPFQGETDAEIFNLIKKGKYDTKNESYYKISQQGKDLIKRLLTLDPNKRISSFEALEHKWFKSTIDYQLNNINTKELKSVLNKLKNHNMETKFNKYVIAILTHNTQLKEEENKLRKIFQFMDLNNDGKLSKEEIIEGYKKLGTDISEYEITRMYGLLDDDLSGFVEYEEFLRATIDYKKLLTEENLKMAFELIDTDKSGAISCEEIKQLIGDEKFIPDNVVSEIFNQIDRRETDEINFDEFKQIMITVMSEDEQDNSASEFSSMREKDGNVKLI
jgi:calcium-dependent protein kinase